MSNGFPSLGGVRLFGSAPRRRMAPRKRGRKRKGLVSRLIVSPARQEIGKAIRKGVRKRTRRAIKTLTAEPSFVKLDPTKALEMERLQIKRRERKFRR
jgi:hypothetical protein